MGYIYLAIERLELDVNTSSCSAVIVIATSVLVHVR
jgi:hypothetical protein